MCSDFWIFSLYLKSYSKYKKLFMQKFYNKNTSSAPNYNNASIKKLNN